MKRSTLSDFLRTVAISALPLAASACCTEHRNISRETVDAFVIDDAAVIVGEGLPLSVCTEHCRHGGSRQAVTVYGCSVADATDGGITALDCDEKVGTCTSFIVAGGRPPLGLRPRRAIDARDPAGAFFAAMAHVEAAAVDGFAELAATLRLYGAPATLVADALDAARDEARHARVAAAFAERHGAASLPPVEIDVVGTPSLETLALANAREGCVFETYGAVVTQWQSRTAGDRAVRRAFVNIASDELRHAELAFAVARWLHPQLDAAARLRVREAQRAAAAELAREIERPHDERLVIALGLPDRDAARGLYADLRARLWA